MFIMLQLVQKMKQPLISNTVKKKGDFDIVEERDLLCLDSQYMNSDSEEELMNSEAQSSSDFQRDLDFGKKKNRGERRDGGSLIRNRSATICSN